MGSRETLSMLLLALGLGVSGAQAEHATILPAPQQITYGNSTLSLAGLPIRLPSSATEDDRAAAPGWFTTMIGPPIERHDIPIIVNGRTIGTVEIVSEPRDEIAEVWENSIALAAVASVTVLVIVGILYWVLGRVLDPLTALGTGLQGLERRDYKVRLARPKVLE